MIARISSVVKSSAFFAGSIFAFSRIVFALVGPIPWM